MEDIIKPYRMIISQEDSLKGSFDSQPLEFVLNKMKTWEIQTIELAMNKVDTNQINEFIKAPNRASFFFCSRCPY